MDFSFLSQQDREKYEAAEELGLLDAVIQHGWRGLSARDSGRIGGYLSAKRKKQKKLGKELDKS
ncbi:MAG TPA: alpha/beta-type small acid-soluble spore protein [Firmicutes bacterium]|nr:alpha/beta-type small acid-soluble spore protein [Bacillota bacterium]